MKKYDIIYNRDFIKLFVKKYESDVDYILETVKPYDTIIDLLTVLWLAVKSPLPMSTIEIELKHYLKRTEVK